MTKTIFLYALALAALGFGLQYIEYKHFVRVLPTETYIIVIAIGFTAMGLWAGRKLTSPGSTASFERNSRAMKYLGISDREIEVLDQLGAGLSNQEIADALIVSANTVKTHLKHVYEKLDVARRTQAVRKARELRLIR